MTEPKFQISTEMQETYNDKIIEYLTSMKLENPEARLNNLIRCPDAYLRIAREACQHELITKGVNMIPGALEILVDQKKQVDTACDSLDRMYDRFTGKYKI